jgi:hypothetical protein
MGSVPNVLACERWRTIDDTGDALFQRAKEDLLACAVF